MVTENTDLDLVGTYEKLKDKLVRHVDNSAIPFGGTSFIPEHQSVHASYSSDPEVPYDTPPGASTDEDNTTAVVVIACVAGAVLVCAVIAGVLTIVSYIILTIKRNG